MLEETMNASSLTVAHFLALADDHFFPPFLVANAFGSTSIAFVFLI
jgi:hypothetical protein